MQEEKSEAEKNKEGKLQIRKGIILEKVKIWFKDPYTIALFSLLLFALAIRLFYFFKFNQQPIWWDEAEYMLKAKRIGFGFPSSWNNYWGPRKPILLAWMFVPFFKLGMSEVVMRFVLVLFSFLGVYSTYLVAREFFDKKVALITTALMSVFWVHLFFTARFLVEMPASPFFLLSLYFFSRGYIKKQGSKYIWLFGVFFAIGFLIRVSYGIFIIPILLYLLLEDKLKFVLKKDLWISAFFAFLVVLPFFIYLFNAYPEDPLGKFIGAKYGRFSFGVEHGSMGWSGVPLYFKDLVNVMKLPFFILMVVGFVIFILDLLVGFDLLLKKEHQNLRVKVLALIWIIAALITFGLTRGYVEQRDNIPIAVFLFSFVGIALLKLHEYAAKYNKILANLLVIGLIVIGSIPQITYGYALTKDKSTSYLPVKEAALWIKQNSNKDDMVYTMSSVQNMYYSERNTGSFSGMTQEDFEGNITLKKPRYLILSIFEPYWLNQKFDFNIWIQNNSNWIRIAREPWFADAQKQQPILIIYEIDWTERSNISMQNTNFSI